MKRFNIAHIDTIFSQGINVPLNCFYGMIPHCNNKVYYIVNPDNIIPTDNGYYVQSMWLYDFNRHDWTQVSARATTHKNAFKQVCKVVRLHLTKHVNLYGYKGKNHISVPDRRILPSEKKPQVFDQRHMKPDRGGKVSENIKYKQVTQEAYWESRGNASIVANSCRY